MEVGKVLLNLQPLSFLQQASLDEFLLGGWKVTLMNPVRFPGPFQVKPVQRLIRAEQRCVSLADTLQVMTGVFHQLLHTPPVVGCKVSFLQSGQRMVHIPFRGTFLASISPGGGSFTTRAALL